MPPEVPETRLVISEATLAGPEASVAGPEAPLEIDSSAITELRVVGTLTESGLVLLPSPRKLTLLSSCSWCCQRVKDGCYCYRVGAGAVIEP
ncbi:hypothetical protein MRB53_014024 [Persea americana]|uniref:Uncharacterized protein n=1 Tax=Persea americana TaxID=3435 RepID=A0ACC2K9V1_PERAE|nr:hypothetical protein MRB53_014024 [Persea americana]